MNATARSATATKATPLGVAAPVKHQPFVGSSTPGPRNGVCPLCPSGRKLKKCCLAPPTPEQYLEHARQLAEAHATLDDMGIRIETRPQ